MPRIRSGEWIQVQAPSYPRVRHRQGASCGPKFRDFAQSLPRQTTGVAVQNVDVDIAKSQLANMLARREPGPAYVHLPCGPNGEVKGGWDADAVAELTAEYRRQTNVRGYTISRWHKHSGRANHRLDCLVYALAALSLSRLKIDDCALQRVEARNIGKSEQTKDPARSPFGARKMLVKSDLDIGGLTGFEVELPPDHPQPAGWGALPEAASASDIGQGAVTGNFAGMIRYFYRVPADCYSVVARFNSLDALEVID